MRRQEPESSVPERARPTPGRAAAAARLAGAASGEDAVAERMRQAARRARSMSVPSPAISGAAALAVAPMNQPQPDPRPQEQPRPRHLKLVPEGLTPAQRRRRARFLVMSAIGAAAMIGLALVYFHVVLAQRQFALDHLQTQVQKAQATYQQQRLEVAELGSPAQIISRAEGQLGMIQPTSVSYLPPAATGGSGAAGGSSVKSPLGQIGPSVVPAIQAPSGDADWPTIKQQLAGIP